MSIKLNSYIFNPYFLLLILSSGSLAFAYFVEYIIHLSACPLCIYQRFPYLVFITLSIISLSSEKNYIKYYIFTAIIAICLAGYHTGVERGIFELSSLCKPLVSISDSTSTEDFVKLLYNKPIATCEKPALVILGLSMTEWNLLLNLGLLAVFIKLKLQSKN
jgi:disulfide bond formation protein DsbB